MAPFTDEYLFIEIANKVCNVFVYICVCVYLVMNICLLKMLM
jgi:hypothetical protein